MRPPLLVNTALRGLRLRSAPSQRLFTLNAISRFNRLNSTVAPATSESCLLPTKDKKPYYITTPIFYVNADPHVGHLYTLVLTDAIKRWQEFKGIAAQLCTGTDEHGIKIQQAAATNGVEPEEFVKKGADMFKNLASTAFCSYDTFVRTTSPEHRDAVQYFWGQLERAGWIYKDKHSGWYSVGDETFYAASQVEPSVDPSTGKNITISKETGRVVEWSSEENYHFKLSEMGPKLLEFYEKNPEFVTPGAQYEVVKQAVEKGLSDLSISRPTSRLSWGIPVPGDQSQTIYVWLDALINYITVSGYPWAPGSEHLAAWPADLHVVGKDILKFHAIYWPAFLLALDLPLPKQILSHAHWTMNHKKMSKSDGNVVNPFYAMERYGVDTMRFYMVHDGGINSDGDYSNDMIVERYKNELQNLGNSAGRVCGARFDIPLARDEYFKGGWKLNEVDKEVVEMAKGTAKEVEKLMEKLDVPNAVKKAMALMHKTNQYLQQQAPWYLVKPQQKSEQNKIIFVAAECIRITTVLLQPFMPTKAGEVLDKLNVEKEKRGFEFAKYGSDDTFGEGTKGKKGAVFPPLSE
ncbi:Similar to Probable methionine--tRNA ligase, mitochondrial; acc. no. Q9C2H9 [Pyronema omphalodes CBS 100304]|uniref:Probable methionine--tRNA ligase, mitochondrial n=1 Tax=Pyronema omphalodes (strain CBS 100304) TaxID=1076935 RepID=U4LHN2_PYROM|nr:Similar to Probable methionine--tRNA ligase, mitochondrial; acc. no. Q9C2H9 [Pyronema omphalodes CBS 100304]